MQLFRGGRVPPRTIARILSRLEAPLGRFAILGNHDYVYDECSISNALRDCGIVVLDHDHAAVQFQKHSIQIIGVPDAHKTRPEAYALLAGLSPDAPTLPWPTIRYGLRICRRGLISCWLGTPMAVRFGFLASGS